MRSDYNLFSAFQRAIFQSSVPYIHIGVEAFIQKFQSPSSQKNVSESGSGSGSSIFRFTIADFGSSTGSNSSAAMNEIIELIRREFQSNSSFLVVHNDLPRNSWTTLFEYLLHNPASYSSRHSDVFAVASGQSFYQQILPSESLHFGYSNVSLHWCSSLPTRISNHCFSIFAVGDEKKLFDQQAKNDWSLFLSHRSKELVPNGILVLQCLSLKETNHAIMNDMYESAKGLHEEGKLSAEELLNYNFRWVWRSVEDFTPPELLKSLNFEVIKAEQTPIELNPIYEDYVEHRDVNVFSSRVVTSTRAWAEPTLVESLDQNRDANEKKELISQYWGKIKEKVAKNPDLYSDSMHNMFVVLRKM